MIGGLEQRGLIERHEGEADANYRHIVNEAFLDKLSAEEAEVIARVWRRLLGKPGK